MPAICDFLCCNDTQDSCWGKPETVKKPISTPPTTVRKSLSLVTNRYEDIYEESVKDPERFWGNLAEQITWSKPWSKVLDNSEEPFTKWFVGGELNACYNAIDRHVENGKGSKTAIIYDSPVVGVTKRITFFQLQDRVSKLAGVLSKIGVKKGDRVLIYMPALPETIMAMLATARLGAIHSVIFGGFAGVELSSRIQHCKPKVIIAANCGVEPNKIIKYLDNVTEAISLSTHKPLSCIVYQRKDVLVSPLDQEIFIDWEEALETAVPHPCVPVEANDTLYLLYTSGTTGQPKGIQRPVGGHLVTLAWTMNTIYGLGPNDVWWCTSDFGWVVGHSYMCYAPLLCGITTVLFEGKPTTTPDPSQYYRVINEFKVNALFTVPTVLRMIKKEDPDCIFGKPYDISTLRTIFVAGEHCDLSSKEWAEETFKVPVYNHWWQTETGHAITATCVGLSTPVKPTKLTAGLPFPGFQVQILREDGTRADAGELGRIMVKLPLPPGTMSSLYNAKERFIETYFTHHPGYYDTMDAGYIDEGGLVYVTARDDDIIKVAGHRLSTLAMENVILSHPQISEACVISVPDKIRSEIPFCFYVMKNADMDAKQISKELVSMVREAIGPVASFRLSAPIRALPLTRSGKILRKAISNLARNKMGPISSTVVDPTVFEDVEQTLRKFGFVIDVDD